MPIQPRSGAPILPISLVAPGFRGLNKQAESSILPVQWATETSNAVFDSSGRLASRKGYANQTGSAISGTPTIVQLHELRKIDGTTQIVFSTSNNKLYKDVSSPSDITGAATVTVGNDWQFINFNNNVYGVQQGEQPIVYDGTTNFADLVAASGTAPTGNCGVAFSGRLWVAKSDKQTIQYSALLDATKWAGADGAGSIDLTSVWPRGMDEIVTMYVFNGALVVFGKTQILLFSDGQGSPLGINPANMMLYDWIASVGCVARDSVAEIEGGDLLFLGAQGVQSLQRLIQEKSNPLENVSSNVRDYLVSFISGETAVKIKGCYSPKNSIYILSFPAGGKTFCFDTRGKMEDGTFRVTEWSWLVPAAAVSTVSGSLYLGVNSVLGKIGLYSGYLDNSAAIPFSYASGWLDLGEDFAPYLKILKSLVATVFTGTSVSVSLKWDTDFQNSWSSGVFTTGASTASEYNIAEYNIAEWSGGITLAKSAVAADSTGQYVRVGLQTNVNNSEFAVQQLILFAKAGRLAK